MTHTISILFPTARVPACLVVDRRGMMLVCRYQTLFTDFTADVRTIYSEAEILVCITVLTLVDRCKPPGHKRFWDRSLYGQGVLGVQRSNHELSLTLESAWDKTWQIQALPEYFRKKKWRFEGRQQGALMRRDTARPTVSPGCTPPGGIRIEERYRFQPLSIKLAHNTRSVGC